MNEQHLHVIEQVQQHTTTTFPLDCLLEWNGGMEHRNRILEWPELCLKMGFNWNFGSNV